MTQTELGYVFGVTKRTVSGWETAGDTMPLIKLIKFSNLYGYSLDYIVGFTRFNINYGNNAKCDKYAIGKRLKSLRLSLNLTQEKIAKACGISQTAYSGYENGHYLINTITLYTICKKNKISMDWIIGRSKNQSIK